MSAGYADFLAGLTIGAIGGFLAGIAVGAVCAFVILLHRKAAPRDDGGPKR